MSKLPNVGTTIFTTMSKMAHEFGAINLSQGFPDFPVDPILITTLQEQAEQNVHQYMPMTGAPALLSEIGVLIKSSYGRDVDVNSELLVTAGATQAIFTAILALIESGDEVIILDPSYDCYEPAIILAGGKPIRIPLNSAYLPDWNLINDFVSSKTKMIITNNPHNPTGRVWSMTDIESLETIMEKNPQMLLLSDEVYEHISFEQKHISVHERSTILDRSIVVSSFGKTFHVTGWKMGYLVAPDSLLSEIKKVHQFNVFCVNSIAQATLAQYLGKTDVSKLSPFYQQKRDVFQNLMKNSRFNLLPCEGTYFQTADYSEISNENDIDFCRTLTQKHGVAAIPISVFNANQEDRKIIRFCFAKEEPTLIAATEKLCKI